MEFHFRSAIEADIPVIATMMADFYAIDGYEFDPKRATDNLHLFIQKPEMGRLWLLLSGEAVVGYMVLTFCFSFEFGGRTAFLDELYINKEYRGQGFGKRTVEFVYGQALELGVQALHLEVETHNKAGIRLYRGFGFKDHSRLLMTLRTYSNTGAADLSDAYAGNG